MDASHFFDLPPGFTAEEEGGFLYLSYEGERATRFPAYGATKRAVETEAWFLDRVFFRYWVGGTRSAQADVESDAIPERRFG